ncbi:MAG: serine hydrolase [Flavobacteriaceae bacterium]
MQSRSIASNLVYQRKIKGYSQEELSGKTNVTVRTIQRIEKGEVQPHLQTVKLLAAALEIEVEDLLALENPKEETIKKKWLLLLHATPILGLVIPLANILIPLFLWIHKREDNPIYDRHGRAIVNFQITMSLLLIIGFIALVSVEAYGFYFFVAIIPYSVLVSLFNIVTAVDSYKCFYPLAIPFLKSKGGSSRIMTSAAIPILFLCFMGCAQKGPEEIRRLDGSTIPKDSLTDQIANLCKLARVQGMAVSIFDNNQIDYNKTFGYRNLAENLELTDSTNIYGASLSKAVFGVLVLKLVEEQLISLDTPLASYLPKKIYEYNPLTRWHDDYSALTNDTLYEKITARMCLNHTSGFPNWRWFETDKRLRVKFEPGTRYHYSGEGLVYLQVVLEKLSGKSLETLAQDRIFKPLNMKNTSYHWQTAFEDNFANGHSAKGEIYPKDIDNEPRAASTLETTPKDYALFLQAVLQQKILSTASWKELFSPQVRIRSERQFGPLSTKETSKFDAIELSYGLGWGVLKTPYGAGVFKEGHGEGFQHYTILFPDTGKGVMLMTNSDNGEGIFKEVLELTLADTYTPWEWENYIPYSQR